MSSRSSRWLWAILPVVAAVWYFWPHRQSGLTLSSSGSAVPKITAVKPAASVVQSASSGPARLSTGLATTNVASVRATNKFAFRLSNTSKSLRELSHDSHAILLANALLDTRNQLNLDIPKNLKAKGDPGAYIVQANGAINADFRATLALAGAKVVSYIPNNAYLVQASSSQASTLAGSGLTVLPYEPYYKVSGGLVAQAESGQTLSPDTLLNVGAFANDGAQVEAQIRSLGGLIVAQDVSPFGPIYRVSPPADWTAIAQLPGVQVVEPTYRRKTANDLARVDLGISIDTVTNENYLNLYGSNVVVEVNDSGIDSTHPDFTLGGTPGTGPGTGTRVSGDSTGSLLDPNGHGTFVAGVIAGNGDKSFSPTNVGLYASGSVSNADFRGKAPLASLFSVGAFGGNDTPFNIAAGSYNPDIYDTSDYYLQTASVSLTKALISNNSWTYGGDNAYDLAAASYDAAVRDALPAVTGSQPVLFVFAAGDNGGGNDQGSGASADSIESPATAKNVITVGALQQPRNITNIVTDEYGNSNAIWLPETESSTLVADYSARGNVGIGVEGDSGRFKPDVVAPGNFVVSTKSSDFDPYSYYNPTSYLADPYLNQIVTSSNGVYGLSDYNIAVPPNAVGLTVQIYPNVESAEPFPTNFPVYFEIANPPDPFNDPGAIDFTAFGNTVNIPPQGPGSYLQSMIASGGVWVSVGDPTNAPVNYDVVFTVVVTNLLGNQLEVLSNLNATLGPYYMYRSGTSVSAPSVSGLAALIQDFFTNTLHSSPSPALLKAMVINGARTVGSYQFAITNAPNDEGWGLPNLPNSLPFAWAAPLQANPPGAGYVAPVTNAYFFQDQSPTNALATGDSQTFALSVGPDAEGQPLRVTLTWTDPPGDPAAAIKLVNNLDIVVTNLDTVGTTNVTVYYGNDFSTAGIPNYSVPETTNDLIVDMVNNVRNIYLQPALGTNYTVTVVARSVNVNAVTAQTNSVVQDYALVVSSGDGYSGVTNAFTMTVSPVVRNPTGGQNITYVTSTNTPLLNQLAGENSPLLGTNTVGVGTNSLIGTNALLTIGMTNQWHFYIVTNFLGYANGAFITFFPYEMSVSRMGTLDDSTADATRPQGDIDLFVAKEPGLLALDPTVISNCVNGIGGDAVSAGAGGTEYVAYSNSVQNQVYYIGVKSEDHLGTTYGFLPVFSAFPFSSLNSDGSESVIGLTLPVNIPPGNPAHPSTALVFALALFPLTIDELIVTNGIFHQNFGDLSGQLTHGNIYDILNSHDGFGNTTVYGYPGTNIIYYDAGYNPINTPIGPVTIPNPHASDGPGSLVAYQGQTAIGPWVLAEVNNVPAHTGSNTVFGLRIYPHTPADKGVNAYIAGQSGFSGYIDVPAGVTNMTLNVTNETLPTTLPPLEVYLRYGAVPTPTPVSPPLPEPLPTVYDQFTVVSNGVAPYIGGSISVGPSSIPPLNPGRYYYEIYNPSADPATNVYVIATFDYAAVPGSTTFGSTGPTPLEDDAVATNTIVITNTENIFSTEVGVVIDHPRVSDLVLTLVSPLNQRYTLVENRGGDTANMGHLNITTNFFGTTSAGSGLGNTNVIGPIPTQGTLVVNYNMYTVPDSMDIYYDGVNIYHLPYTSGVGQVIVPYGPGASTNITIVMDQGGDPDAGSLWTYTPSVINENYSYLTLTDNTNLAQTLIKFAIPPFNLNDLGTNYVLSDFEVSTNGDYYGPTNIYDTAGGWTLPAAVTNYTPNFTNSALLVTNVLVFTNNLVSVVADPATAYNGTNYLALGLGAITRTIPTIPQRTYTISYSYRGPGIAGWWRGEGNALDSSSPETNGDNGELIGRFTFPEGEVGQAFGLEDQGNLYQFAGTNDYVQIPAAPGLDVGKGSGFTVEGWINPTNLHTQEPLVEWLSRIPTNTAVTNIVILAGPFLNRATEHYYYMLGATNWTTSEMWATNMGGHLVTVNDANEQNWVYDTFGNYGGTNRNLWIGLNDAATEGDYVWTDGQVPNYYNWLTGQPINCNGNEHYTMMLGLTNSALGLWVLADENGGFCTNISNYRLQVTNVYGVVELNTIPTNGVQFWVSVTNSPATGNSLLSSNGCLYANVVDTTNGNHEIWSAPGLVQSNVYQHVALTYNTNSGIATLYYNGTNVCATNLGVFTPKTTGDLLLGKDMSLLTNNYFSGGLDEMSIYSRCLSDAEIAGIYEISASTTNNPGTNGQVIANGKFDPMYHPAIGLAEAIVTLGDRTSVILGNNTNWQRVDYTFTATSNSVPFQIIAKEPGILLDDFTVSETAQGNLYYQPEQPLDGLVGESAAGTWTLEILDDRVGATNALAKLVSWQLQFVLQTNNSIPITLYPETPGTNTIPPGDIAYFYVPIPTWGHWATNLLVSATSPVELLFNPTNPPTGSNPGDQTLLASSTGDVGAVPPNNIFQTTNPAVAPLTSTNFYYLGVKNISAVPAQVVVRVDFDITALTNGLPVQGTLTTNDTVRYFSFDVSTNNPLEATFQLLKLSGNADLVASYGTPLPNLTNDTYGSFNSSNANETIYIQTNSLPVPLAPGRWYLGVFRNDAGPVTYSVLAKEVDAGQTNVITLTNNVPFNFTAGPGAALTNFFLFNVTNAAQNVHFELYNMTGNGDLTVQSNGLPLMPPFYNSSQEPGLDEEYIYLRTNSALTNLVGRWYLGVPNNETNQISFTILAVNDSLLITNTTTAFPGAVGAGAYTTGGRGSTNVYHVINLDDSGPGSLRYGLNEFANNAMIVFDVSGNIALQSPLVITNSNWTIAGQTAPGDGITLQNYPTLLDGVSNAIVRYLRFRPGDTGTNLLTSTNLSAGDSLAFTNAFNVVIDHVSASWSTNAVLSVLNSSNVTVQWSMIADSFTGTNVQAGVTNNLTGSGSILRYGNGSLTFNHNLYANNNVSSPELGDNLTLDFVNNVIYNWGRLPGWSITNDPVADPAGSTNRMNYAANYVLASAYSQTNDIAFWSASTNTWVFQTNNFIDAYTNQITGKIGPGTNAPTGTLYVLNGSDTGWSMFSTNTSEFGDPFPLPYPGILNATTPTATAEEAYVAYERVLDFAGDQMARDGVDRDLVRQVRTQAGTFISSQTQAGGWPTLNSQPTLLDTDQDGLPDYWEITFGLNPTNAADGALINTNTGYSQLETYLNWLAAPHALTTRTNPVAVHLYQLAGGTGRLSFFVTNAINGSVVLTNDAVTNYFYAGGVYTNSVVIYSNTLAIFTPTNGYTSSFANPASFDFYVTNNDTFAWFGPQSVSVVVSATNFVTSPTIIVLTNGMPFTVTSDPVYLFTTADSPGAIVFQVYNMSGPGSLVVQPNGTPVGPVYAVTSGAARTNSVQAVVQTNFALSNIGATAMSNLNANWYIGVTNAGTNSISYTVVAREIPTAPTVITLTNGVPYTFTAGPGPALTNFFVLPVGNSPAAVQFQLYNQSGNGDLTVETNALPFAPLYYQASQQPGTDPEFVQVTTNNGGPANLNARWFLGVPNNDPGVITCTILAQEINTLPTVIETNTPVAGTIAAGQTNYYLVNVPQYAVDASNSLIAATGPLNVWYTTNVPPAINAGAVELLTGSTAGTATFGTNSTPALVSGGYYYLAVVNPGVSTVDYSLEVSFEFSLPVSGTPQIVTLPATSVSAFAATLNASAIANGSATTVYFAYGQTTAYGSLTGSVELTTNLYSTYPVAIGISNLLPGAIYHFQAFATNNSGVLASGGDLTFTNPAAAPAVVTVGATNIGTTSVTLEGLVNPNGAPTTVAFAFGTNTTYGQFTGTTNLNTGLNMSQPVSISLGGLLPGAVYHFAAVGFNSAGTNYGADLTFTNAAESPVVTTVSATNITSTSAKLQASVTPNGAAATVTFEYGTNGAYGSFTSSKIISTNLNGTQLVGIGAGNLLPGLTYYFQAIAVNAAGSNYGGQLSFVTPAIGPSVITLAATNVTATSATISAQVNPNGAATTVYFVYGATTNYGNTSTPYQLTGNLETAQLVSTLLTNLQAGVNYHYQAVAFNSAGTNYGADMSLIPTVPPVVVTFTGILSTNGGFLISWLAPTNDIFKVQWNTNLATTNWNSFTNVVTYTGPVASSNGVFTFFDNGTQDGGFGGMKFYRLILVAPTLPPGGAIYRVNPLSTVVVTNTAADINPTAVLNYTVFGTLGGTNVPTVNANGVVFWTPTVAQAGMTNFITTVVTAAGVTPVTANNTFEVIVNPLPSFNKIQVGVDGVLLQWTSVVTNQFQIGWTTNLATPWTFVPTNAPYLTSPTTNFFYLDTNSPAMMKFYELREVP